ncbi:hypothetical protein [Streptomyces sp. NPDC013457]|uniref:hypothetical protein n=1 Tax=Streptomyces sp. NPDC013457 TaxID=3364866 RepID=UPI0036F4B90B
MAAPLPRRTPFASPDEEPQPYGIPSPDLIARAESGLAKFLERSDREVHQSDAETLR